MRIVGLTGGIASGKSTVSEMLRGYGAGIVDADLCARQVVEPGSRALQEIVEAFGPGVLQADGSLDRKALGRVVFGDAAERARLNAIVHPRVFAAMQAQVEAARARDVRLLVLDVPLLLESSHAYPCEAVVVVYVDEATQRARLMARDGVDKAAAQARIQAQLPIEEKKRRADILIDNRGTLEQTRAQVADLAARFGLQP